VSHGRAVRRGRGASRSARGKRRLPRAALHFPAIAILSAGVPMALHGVLAISQAPSTILCSGWAGCDSQGYDSYGYASHGYQSYWDMSPGDECTNYVAYVESQVFDAPTPGYLLGNGGQWAVSAAAHGIVVNDVPSVGAVAEWDGGSFGMGPLGHVAVVERVGPDDSYIDISQQNIYTDVDGYDWTRINAGFPASSWQEWPSHFIHFPIKGSASVGYYNPIVGSIQVRDALGDSTVQAASRVARPGMVPLVGDWAGPAPGIGYYDPRNGSFHLRAALGSASPAIAFRFGPPGMVPLAGKWAARHRDGVGYYDPRTGTFYLRDALSAGRPSDVLTFGPPGMVPLVGDWTGKGADGVGYYDPRTGTFYLRDALSAGRPNYVFTFGPPGMIPVVGNWAGGKAASIGVYNARTGWFLLRNQLTRGRASYSFRFGPRGMVPLAGDWLG
jgi:surface antigen